MPEYLASRQPLRDVKFPLFCQLGTTQKVRKEPQLRIPTYWNSKDRSPNIELAPGNLKMSYIGSGKSDSDAAAVRANYPIPSGCAIYYFEVCILSKGRDGYISIGFESQKVALGRLPGWEEESWGYHGVNEFLIA
jgi:hypothetical protein